MQEDPELFIDLLGKSPRPHGGALVCNVTLDAGETWRNRVDVIVPAFKEYD